MSKKKQSKKARAEAKARAAEVRRGALLSAVKLLAMIAAMGLATAGAMFLLPGEGTAGVSGLVISEVMSGNPNICLGVDGAFYDWLELKNTGDVPVDLTGWKLTDKGDLRGAFTFAGGKLPAGGTMVVYCDDAPEGYAGDAVFTGFRLSGDGETLMLGDDRGRVAQVLQLPALAPADVYLRSDATGTYRVEAFFKTESAERYAPDLSPAYRADTVRISELMADNVSTLTDADGDYSDWIELYNGGAAAVNLEGWTLSDDDMDRKQWTFPAVTLQPGEYLVLFASGKDRAQAGGELHTCFGLAGDGETVRLYDPECEVASWAKFGASGPDCSWIRGAEGTMTACELPSPGAENTEAGWRQSLADGFGLLTHNDLGLYINEVLCSGDGVDWLELANTSAAEIDLSGMGLSDNPARPRKWRFPEGTRIAGGGYLAVALTGAEGASGLVDGRMCASLALSSGETVTLSHADGALLDMVRLLNQRRNVSYGRAAGQDRYRYFAELTPGKANSAKSYAYQANDVVFSTPGGLQSGKSLQLTLTADEGMSIYYTTDGSEPSLKSRVYTGPLNLTANTLVKAVAWRSDALQSNTGVESYVFGNHKVRLVCIYGSRSRLNGSGGMLNTGVKGDGTGVFVQIYEPDGTKLVSQKCHLKLTGHGSRTHNAQQAFSLRAKREYGDNRFEAALFTHRPYTEYKSVVMRASGQDCFQSHMKDSVLTALAADTTVLYQETELSVVYVNGKYWGVYNMREQINGHMIAQYEGWDNPDDVVIVEGSLNRMFAAQGSSSGFRQMLAWVKRHDLSKDANVEQLRQYMDIENYLDYVLLQMYTSNQDLNNCRCYCNPRAGGRWRWILADVDLSFEVNANPVARWLKSGGVGTVTQQDNTLFIALMKNAAVRDYFCTRAGELLATTLSKGSVVGRIKARAAALNPEMKANCKRWGWSVSTWQNYVKKMASFANKRPAAMMEGFRKSFKLSDAKMQQYFGEAKRVN